MQCSRLRLFSFVLAVSTLLAPRFCAAQKGYKVTDLGTLIGQADSYVWQQSVNNHGYVAVYTNSAGNPNAFYGDTAFLWMSPKKTQLLPGLPGSADTLAFSLNDLDEVVGDSNDASGYVHAVVWQGGVVKPLGELPGDTGSDAYVINNQGQAVGDSYNTSVVHAVLWKKGTVTLLPSLNGGSFSQAYGIGAAGKIVGISGPDGNNFHAVLWMNGAVADLGTLGGSDSYAVAINAHGQIAGMAQVSSGYWHPALWQNGGIADLGNFGTDAYGLVFSINRSGQAVGFSGASLIDISTAHALLWENGVMINLQTQISAKSGWVLEQAAGINDRGQISGFGWHNGQLRAYLLTPK